jgi:hypothetical protein
MEYITFDDKVKESVEILLNIKLLRHSEPPACITHMNLFSFPTENKHFAFRTNGGVHIHDDNVTVTAPTALWVKV